MISAELYQIISLDLPAILTALFACMACALLGNFLVLRKLSLMGDAISHAVLPGIVVAFLLSGSRGSLPVFMGAAAAGVITAVAVELLRSFGRLDSGAAMGVVFSIMFALGVLLIEQAAARNVDLDADCLLHGQLETIFWYPPQDFKSLLSFSTMDLLPQEVITSFSVFTVSFIFVILFFKELSMVAFDPALATALGFNSSLMHYALMVVVAAAVVASFSAVGSILVIAMIICPAATARFYTDRLKVQIALSLIFAFISVITGYIAGGYGPEWLGYENAVNAGGMITVVTGLLLFMSALLAPEYGIIARQIRVLSLSLKVVREDIIAEIYRYNEKNIPQKFSMLQLKQIAGNGILFKTAIFQLLKSKLLVKENNMLSFSEAGQKSAELIIRSHRLWESFLVEKAGLQPDHVHSSASKLEHFTQSDINQQLSEDQSHVTKDPHGKPIP